MILLDFVLIVSQTGIYDSLGNNPTGEETTMVNLELSDDEAKVLQNVLENYHSHLDLEIHRTYKREFRDALKEREMFLAAVIERLRKQRGEAA
jgi:hypothetical protein